MIIQKSSVFILVNSYLQFWDIYYKFFDADLFTYTREITIGHHSNLVDFIQVFN